MVGHRFIASAFGPVAAGLAMLAVATPAAATITAVKIAATQPAWNGTCPMTVSFAGSITGTPGTQFSYDFLSTVDNVVKTFGQGTVTLPASGSMSIYHNYAIGSSTTGVNEEQVRVHNIAGGQADIISNAAGFSVTCKVDIGKKPNVRGPVTLHPVWFARRDYAYAWQGLAPNLPERGTGPCPDLCVGWQHFHQGDSLALVHLNDYYRAFLGYDRAAFKNLKMMKAVLTLTIANGSDKCFGGVGRAVLSRTPVMRGGTQRFEAPYPDDGDFGWHTPLLRQNAGTIEVDVTSLVEAWVLAKVPNQGFVLRGKVENNGADGNDECTVGFRPDARLTIEELPVP